MRTRVYSIFIFCLITVFFSGCLNKQKLLKKNQYLLYQQTIKGNERVSSDELTPFFRQEANARLLGLPVMPFLWFYYQGTKLYDREKVARKITETTDKFDRKISAARREPKKERLAKQKEKKLDKLQTQLDEGNFLMRKIGEPPVIFDTTQARQTAEQMRSYLFTKGYFNSAVAYDYSLDTSRRTARVTYQVTENQPYKLRQITYETDNPTIDSILQKGLQSPLQTGMLYDEAKISEERDAIEKLLKNNGYYLFSKQYVTYEYDSTVVDSTLGNHQVDLKAIINKPADRPNHRQFRIDDVYVTTDANVRGGRGKRDTVTYNNVTYAAYDSDRFSKKVLDSKLLLHPGDLYSLDNTLETQRLFSGLDIFKFANVFFDTTGNDFDVRINASPIERYTISDEIGVNVSQGFPGPFANVTFKARNVFGGLEIFEINARGSIEGQSGFSDNNQVYASQEVGVNTSLIFPHLLFPTRLRFLVNRYNPKTRLLIGYNLTNRPEYTRYGIRGSMTYSLQKDVKHQFTFSPLDLNFLNTLRLTAEFDSTLDSLQARGSSLRQSFQRSFVSSVSGSYTYNDNEAQDLERNTHYLRVFGEIGGLLSNVIENTGIFNTEDINGITFYRFYKLNPDFRYYLPMSKKSSWAFRVNVGLASPLGKSNILPYEKFFFAGGSNSIRAWPPRRLGPGADPDSVNADGSINYKNNYLYEEPGDILLESSVEYRFDIVSFLEGALFVDAGNVWVLNSNLNKPDGVFSFNRFFKQIAVGTGFGLRFDFSFLILRFDVGIKAYDPGKPPGEKFMLKNISWQKPFGDRQQTVINIGIGYPF